MLHSIFKSTDLKLIDIANEFGFSSLSYLHRILRGQQYKEPEFYDKLYDILENAGGRVPRNEKRNITLYPTSKAHGSWDVYFEKTYLATICFVNLYDLYNFLYERDNRLRLLMNFLVENSKFDNRINKL